MIGLSPKLRIIVFLTLVTAFSMPAVVLSQDTSGPTVFSYHSPQFPAEGNVVTIDATASDPSGITSVNIYADNQWKKTCFAASCSYSQVFSAGTHTYYAWADDNAPGPFKNVAYSGTGSFTVAADTTPPTILVVASPNPAKAPEDVTLTVSANDNNGISTIAIYVDGVHKKTCSQSLGCSYSQMYSQGNHNYYAEVWDASSQQNYKRSDTQSFSVSGLTKTFKIVFVPLNFGSDLSEFNRKADAGFNTFKAATPFNEAVLSPMLQYQKLGSSCNCPQFALSLGSDGLMHSTYNCEAEVLQCIRDAGVAQPDATAAIVNLDMWYGEAFWERHYAVASKYTTDEGNKFIVTHEALHLFKFCDMYEKWRYDEQTQTLRGFGILAESNPAAYNSCLNPYPLTNGVGPIGSCNTLCSPSSTLACNSGVCGTYLGGPYPYNVDFMGQPWLNLGPTKLANPVGLDPTGYAIMRSMLTDYGFSLGGCTGCSGANEVNIMELDYTISTNDQVSLKSAKKTFSSTIITQGSTNEYSIKIYSTSGSLLFSSPIAVTFMTADGNPLSETPIYQRIPWNAGARHVIVAHNNNRIAEWDLQDTDNDNYPNLADNCPTLANPDQKNTDKEIQNNDMIAPFFIGDNVGDACDNDDDNDGYFDRTESMFIGTDPLDPCGTDGWPADLYTGGIPSSTNRITVTDITSFLAPVRRINTNVGDYPNNARWDLVVGKGAFATDINIQDLTSILVLQPPMFGGNIRAFNGPECPIPP